jgi:hypothetical protein
VSKSSDDRTLEVEIPSSLADDLASASGEELRSLLDWANRFLALEERETEAWLRKWMVFGLAAASAVVLGVSLLLIVGEAFELSHLPKEAITALVISVAAEFVGMFYVVVRYLFPRR